MSFNRKIANLIIEESRKNSILLHEFQLPDYDQKEVYKTAKYLIDTNQIYATIKFFGDNRPTIEFVSRSLSHLR